MSTFPSSTWRFCCLQNTRNLRENLLFSRKVSRTRPFCFHMSSTYHCRHEPQQQDLYVSYEETQLTGWYCCRKPFSLCFVGAVNSGSRFELRFVACLLDIVNVTAISSYFRRSSARIEGLLHDVRQWHETWQGHGRPDEASNDFTDTCYYDATHMMVPSYASRAILRNDVMLHASTVHEARCLRKAHYFKTQNSFGGCWR